MHNLLLRSAPRAARPFLLPALVSRAFLQPPTRLDRGTGAKSEEDHSRVRPLISRLPRRRLSGLALDDVEVPQRTAGARTPLDAVPAVRTRGIGLATGLPRRGQRLRERPRSPQHDAAQTTARRLRQPTISEYSPYFRSRRDHFRSRPILKGPHRRQAARPLRRRRPAQLWEQTL